MQVRHVTVSLRGLRHLKWDFDVLKQEGDPNGPISLQTHPFPAGRDGKHPIMSRAPSQARHL